MKAWLAGCLAGLIIAGVCLGLCGIVVHIGGEALIKSGSAAAVREHNDLARLILAACRLEGEAAGELTDDIIANIFEPLIASGTRARLSDSAGVTYGDSLTAAPVIAANESGATSTIVEHEHIAYVQTASVLSKAGRELTLVAERSLAGEYARRNKLLSAYLLCGAACLAVGVGLGGVCGWHAARQARPLAQRLEAAAAGDYVRVPQSGGDQLAELRGLNADCDAMMSAVQRAMAKLELTVHKREEFVTNFAHELKTPLTSIIGYADMLRAQMLDPEREFIAANYIYSEGRRLEALSLKLMELFVTGSGPLQLKLVDARRYGQEVQRISSAMLLQHDMNLEGAFEEGLVRLEPGLFTSLLTNVIDNARKASEPGSIIELRGAVRGAEYVYSVVDHGRGMRAEELGRITEAFYMVDKSRARAQHGAGLGLALAQSIAQAHSSELTFASTPEPEPAHGTVVSVALPLAHTGRRHRSAG